MPKSHHKTQQKTLPTFPEVTVLFAFSGVTFATSMVTSSRDPSSQTTPESPRAVAVDPAKPSAENDDRLVVCTGKLQSSTPIEDPDFGLKRSALRLRRTVWMRQKKHPSATGESLVWETYRIERGLQGKADNPTMPIHSADFDNKSVRLGRFVLSSEMVAQARSFVPLVIPASLKSQDVPAARLGRIQVKRTKDCAFLIERGNPDGIGNLKITFEEIPFGTFTAVGRQKGNKIVPYKFRDGSQLAQLLPGKPTPEQLRILLRDTSTTETTATKIILCVIYWISAAITSFVFFFSGESERKFARLLRLLAAAGFATALTLLVYLASEGIKLFKTSADTTPMHKVSTAASSPTGSGLPWTSPSTCRETFQATF